MPFQSEKQRRYLWANEPEIAREWTDRYGAMNGGIMNGLNRRHYLTGANGINSLYDRAINTYNEEMEPMGVRDIWDALLGGNAQATETLDLNDADLTTNIEELSSIYNPARDYGQFFRNRPVNERNFMTPIKEGIGEIPNKIGQGWDFAQALPGMAMSALSGIPGLGLLMGMLQESPEQKAMMGLYNTQEYQNLLNEIPGMSNYNPVYAGGAGYGLSNAAAKRIAKRTSPKTLARIAKLPQWKQDRFKKDTEKLQKIIDQETAYFNKPNTGVGAQGGGGGTNIGGGQQTHSGPVGGSVSHADAREARGGMSGWGL